MGYGEEPQSEHDTRVSGGGSVTYDVLGDQPTLKNVGLRGTYIAHSVFNLFVNGTVFKIVPDRKCLNFQIDRTFHDTGRLNAHVIVAGHVRYEPQTANCMANAWYCVYATFLLRRSGRYLDMPEQFRTTTAICNMNMTVLH
jgi:hypothetical protein